MFFLIQTLFAVLKTANAIQDHENVSSTKLTTMAVMSSAAASDGHSTWVSETDKPIKSTPSTSWLTKLKKQLKWHSGTSDLTTTTPSRETTASTVTEENFHKTQCVAVTPTFVQVYTEKKPLGKSYLEALVDNDELFRRKSSTTKKHRTTCHPMETVFKFRGVISSPSGNSKLEYFLELQPNWSHKGKCKLEKHKCSDIFT